MFALISDLCNCLYLSLIGEHQTPLHLSFIIIIYPITANILISLEVSVTYAESLMLLVIMSCVVDLLN